MLALLDDIGATLDLTAIEGLRAATAYPAS